MIEFNKANSKGKIGELIVGEVFKRHGWIVYTPQENMSHAFDMIVIKDKKEAMAVDVKTKPARNYYPDTGLDLKDWNIYKEFTKRYTMTFWIIFVDENSKTIYGNYLEAMEKPVTIGKITYPLIIKTNEPEILFPLQNMITFAKLTDQEANEIKAFNQRNYKYV